MALPTASDNNFPKILLDMQTSTPAAPSNEDWKLFAKPDGIYARSSNSTVGPFGATGSGLTNPMTTTGDMIYSSSGTTPARLAVGSNGQFMRTNSTPLPAWDIPPGFEFDYAQVTASTNITATTEGTANTVVTGQAITYDGATIVIIEFYAPSFRPDTGAAGRRMDVVLFQDGSAIGYLGTFVTPAGSALNLGSTLKRRLTPTNASHTYSIRAFVNSGTGIVSASTGASGLGMPAFMRITKA